MTGRTIVFRLRGFHPLWPDLSRRVRLKNGFVTPRGVHKLPKVRPATPHAQRSWPYIHVVWAVPRSLATTSGVADCFPFLQVLRCFNSLGWLRRPMNSAGDHRGLPGGVAPFGDPRVACIPANRGLSQVATSFIASRCQGIHHTPLLAWSKK